MVLVQTATESSLNVGMGGGGGGGVGGVRGGEARRGGGGGYSAVPVQGDVQVGSDVGPFTRSRGYISSSTPT